MNPLEARVCLNGDVVPEREAGLKRRGAPVKTQVKPRAFNGFWVPQDGMAILGQLFTAKGQHEQNRDGQSHASDTPAPDH